MDPLGGAYDNWLWSYGANAQDEAFEAMVAIAYMRGFDPDVDGDVTEWVVREIAG